MEADEGNEPVPAQRERESRLVRALRMARWVAIVLEPLAQAANSEVLTNIVRTSVIALGLAVNVLQRKRR